MPGVNKKTNIRDYPTVVGLLLAIIGVVSFVEASVMAFSDPQSLSHDPSGWIQLLRVLLIIWAFYSIFLYGNIIKPKNRNTVLYVTAINGIWLLAALLCAIITFGTFGTTMAAIIIMDVIVVTGGVLSLHKQSWPAVVISNVVAILSVGFYVTFSYYMVFIIVWCIIMPIICIASLVLLALSRDRYAPFSDVWFSKNLLKPFKQIIS